MATTLQVRQKFTTFQYINLVLWVPLLLSVLHQLIAVARFWPMDESRWLECVDGWPVAGLHVGMTQREVFEIARHWGGAITAVPDLRDPGNLHGLPKVSESDTEMPRELVSFERWHCTKAGTSASFVLGFSRERLRYVVILDDSNPARDSQYGGLSAL